MEDMPIGALGRLVEELEAHPDSLSLAWGLCPECGAKVEEMPHYEQCPRRKRERERTQDR